MGNNCSCILLSTQMNQILVHSRQEQDGLNDSRIGTEFVSALSVLRESLSAATDTVEPF